MGHREGKARTPWETSSGVTKEVTAELCLKDKTNTYLGEKSGNDKTAKAWRSKSKEHHAQTIRCHQRGENTSLAFSRPSKGKVKTQESPDLPCTSPQAYHVQGLWEAYYT